MPKPLSLTRRSWLKGAGQLAAVTTLANYTILSAKQSEEQLDYTLVVKPQPIELLSNTLTPAWTFNGSNPAPILRLKQNRRAVIKVINQLPEPTTIHWHGIRLPNHADGVPFLTQQPIAPGQSYTYRFTPPDAGTFWYHPHMNSLEQLSRGLVGMIIVEEEEAVAFDADLPLLLKDWRLNPDGSFAAFSDPRAAARTGTLGNYATVNGLEAGTAAASFDLPAAGWCRLRLANCDNTRVYTIACEQEAWVLALEGNPLAEPRKLEAQAVGAGMRLDLLIKMPEKIGTPVKLLDMKGRFGFTLCELRSSAPKAALIDHRPRLPQNPFTEVDLTRARKIPLVFEWAGALSPGFSKQTQAAQDTELSTFWTINKRAWDGHGADLPEPLATLKHGEHVIFQLHNATPHHHPIHLHGFTYKVLSSDQRDIQPYHSDTVLMRKYERMEVAIVADNIGNWMFHCHVIEHMKTGLMGYIRVVA